MKKHLFIATAALTALASCTSDDFVGNTATNDSQQEGNGAIVFSTGMSGTTRADHVGADAANLLDKHFTVGGFKGDGTAYTEENLATGTVFDNYSVTWTANTAATTESNTSDWEYVGIRFLPISNLYVNEDTKNLQTIKYWDYTASQYDFVAYSTGTATEITTGTPESGNVRISKIDATSLTTAAYTLKGAADDLAKCYIADMVTVYKSSSTGPLQYGSEVPFSFRSLASKVRVALYETIPGYSVKDVKFYTAESATQPITSAATETKATLFTTGGVGDENAKNHFYTAGTFTVKFPTIGSSNVSNSDYNKAHVAFTAETSGKVTTKDFSTLNYTTNEYKEKSTGSIWLGRTSATASFAGTESPNHYYQTVLPNEEGTVLELRVDYTLESIDGSGEEIKVHGATAYVPAIYAAWKPNYAYTYIFKISDNTNGWTSTVETDPKGLYPITFDAVVVDSEENTQSTITTVATPSITTYQKGHDITKDEYSAADGDIYVQVMQGGTLVTNLNETSPLTKTFFYKLNENKTEAEVMDALNIRKSLSGGTITGRNGLVLTPFTFDATITTIPGADGNDITINAGEALKFTPEAGTYAFVYRSTTGTPSDIITYVELTEDPGDWVASEENIYYSDAACTTKVTTAYAAGNYYKKYTNLNNVYAVKVIKVVE